MSEQTIIDLTPGESTHGQRLAELIDEMIAHRILERTQITDSGVKYHYRSAVEFRKYLAAEIDAHDRETLTGAK